MTRITWEAEKKVRETAEDTRKDEQFERSLKRVRGYDITGLTCAEANVDSILSEGESI